MGWKTSSLGIALTFITWAALAPHAAAQAGPAYAELATVAAQSGALQLFAIRRDNQIERRYQLQPGAGFSHVQVLGGEGLDIAAVQLADASLDAFIIGMDDALWENRQQADGSWSGWIRLGGQASRVAAVSAADGTVALLSIGADDQIELRQRAPHASDLSAPEALGFQAKRLAAVADATGAGVTLLAVGLDDAVWHGTLDLAAPSSSDWESWGGLVHDVSVARSASGSLEAVLIGDDRALWSNVLEDGMFAGWHDVGGDVARLDLVRGPSALLAFALAADGGVEVATQDDARSWSAFTPLDTREDLPPPAALDSTFSGNVLVEIPSLNVSVTRDLTFDVRFSADRTRVAVTSFAPIVTEPFDTPFGSNVSTVTWVSGGMGTYDPSTGRVDIPITLHFDQSLNVPLVSTDVDADFGLSTAAAGGAPLDPETGQLALAASSTFTGSGANPLRGAAVRVVLRGAFDPRP